MVIDKDGTAERLLHPRLDETEVLHIRGAPGRHEKALRDDGFGDPVAQDGERRAPFRRLVDRLIGEVAKDGDAFARKIVGQRGADLRLHLREKAATANERHVDTGAREHLSEFHTDIAASEDRSEEHTSELQSLMRISYAVFC